MDVMTSGQRESASAADTRESRICWHRMVPHSLFEHHRPYEVTSLKSVVNTKCTIKYQLHHEAGFVLCHTHSQACLNCTDETLWRDANHFSLYVLHSER